MSAVTAEGLDVLTIPPSVRLHTATVIWIHVSFLIIPNLPRISLTFTHLMQGLGDTGRGMASFVRVLSRYYACNHIKWILPHALVISTFIVDVVLRNDEDPLGGLPDVRSPCLPGTFPLHRAPIGIFLATSYIRKV
jgi:hypothetical protein